MSLSVFFLIVAFPPLKGKAYEIFFPKPKRLEFLERNIRIPFLEIKFNMDTDKLSLVLTVKMFYFYRYVSHILNILIDSIS